METYRNKDNDATLLIKCVKNACMELGYSIENIGLCRIESLSRFISCRSLNLIPKTGTVIVLTIPFYSGSYCDRNVALYAIPNDYHHIVGKILEDLTVILRNTYTENTFFPFVDSSPIPEVEAACRAGLGVYGQNGQLITPQYGSYVFICEIVTDLHLKIDEHTIEPCLQCGKCIKACPTGALGINSFHKERCRSFITQKKGVLDLSEQSEVLKGGLAWGCDICTQVCPYNAEPQLSEIEQMHENTVSHIEESNLDELLITKSYGWRGKSVLLRNLNILEKRKQ